MSETLHNATIRVDVSQALSATQDLATQVSEVKAQVMEASEAAATAAESAAEKTTQATERARDAKGRFIPKVKEGQEATEELGKDAQQTGEQLTGMGHKGSTAAGIISTAIRTIELSAIISQVQGVAAAFGDLAQPAIQFEQAMADLSAITGSVGEELEDLKATARRVGVESGLGATESARAFTILASQIDVPIDQLKELQRQTITLAQAGALPLQDAADAVAGTLNQFGYEANQAARVVNVLAAGSRAGGSEVVDLAQSFKVAGAAANAAGVSVEETAAALEILARNNTKGAEAGTAMRNMLIAMQTRLGIDISKTGFVGGLQAIQKHLSTMGSETEKTTFLAKAFGRENIVAAQFLLQNANEVKKMTKEVTGSNAAIEQANIRNNTWAHHLEVMRSKLDEFKISLNEATGGMLPWMAGLGEQLVPIAQLTPLLGGLKGAFGGISKVLTNSPLSKYALIFGAIAGAVYMAYEKSETFRAACQEVMQIVQGSAGALMEQLKPAFDSIMGVLRDIMPSINQLVVVLGDVLASTIRSLMPILRTIIELFARLLPPIIQIIEALMPLVDIIIRALVPALDGLGKMIQALEPIFKLFEWWITNFILKPLEWAISLVADLISWLGELFELDPPTDKIEATTKAIDDQTRAINDNKTARGEAATAGAAGTTTPTAPDPESTTDAPTITPHGRGFSSHKQSGEEKKVYNLTTIEGLTNNISKLQEQLNKSTVDEAIILQRKIDEHQKILDKLKERIAVESQAMQKVGIGETLDKAGSVAQRVDIWGRDKKQQEGDKKKWDTKDLVSKAALSAPEQLYNATKKSLDKTRKEWEQHVKTVQNAAGNVADLAGNLGGALGSLGDLTESSMLKSAGAWLSWGANVASTIKDALPNLLALFNANLSVTASEAGKSQAGIPVVGPIMAAASIAAIIASLVSVPKINAFADGGIVYGPTLSLMGEYEGASNNPEIIAPLDKLRSLIQPQEGGQGGQVEFRIRGRELVGILSKEGNIRKLS